MVKKLYADVVVGWPVRIEYETAKLGRGTDGALKLVTFPDVYSKMNPTAAAERLLGGRIPEGLEPLIKFDLGLPMNIDRRESLYEEVKRHAYLR